MRHGARNEAERNTSPVRRRKLKHVRWPGEICRCFAGGGYDDMTNSEWFDPMVERETSSLAPSTPNHFPGAHARPLVGRGPFA